ncbi:hypothetical protein [Nitrosomonas sp. Is37]|uniref:hypothetical protein n=1 Tax=Nitrosomonas sp. Is37 TaxID=3080535 RepID=UPI00294B71B5|nr:hypothetical protein [Nitrosomonas sp. Is37]MDV6345399.1 hypothetical protein [Nitrosomonas sp. Is37]
MNTTPANESTDRPLTYEDIKIAFQEVGLFVSRTTTLVNTALELSEQKGLPYELMAETMNVLNEFSREVNAYEVKILKTIKQL